MKRPQNRQPCSPAAKGFAARASALKLSVRSSEQTHRPKAGKKNPERSVQDLTALRYFPPVSLPFSIFSSSLTDKRIDTILAG